MAGNGAKEVMVSMSEHAECSSATVEIKIKTLDSQTYKLRVDKYVPVPALKDQIATVTGVLSEQQRLICRGKVLKDDQLLSAYHVEDGHTLHLVVRQPVPPSEILSDYPASDPMASGGHDLSNQTRPSVLVGTINVSEQRDGALPDLGRIVSAVLSSFGTGSIGGISEGAELREHLVRSLSGITDSTRQQPDQAPNRVQPNSMNGVSPLSNAIPLDHLAPLVIPDSLTTLSQYLSHMQREFSSSEFAVRDYGNNSQAVEGHGRAGRESNAASEDAGGQLGLPTPASLAEVMLSTRQLLVEQAGECISQLARQLVEHTSVTDPVARMGIQSNAIRFGDLLQKLGALFFELGRTTMTLRMGQAPGDAVVNAGPAVFISTSGPNPIMVQPLPFQSGSSFGAIPVANMQSGSGFSTGAFGSGFLPRDIDIRIRTGSSMPSANANHPTEAQQTPGQNNAAISRADAGNQATAVPGNSSLMDPGVRVLPIRTVIRALPAALRRAPSDSSDGSVGLFYPVLARVQRASNGSRGSQTSNGVANEQQPSSESTFRREGYVFPESDGIASSAARDGQGFPAQMDGRFEQLLRTLFPGQQVHLGDFDYRVPASTSTAGPAEATEAAAGGQEESTPRATDEGIFLSNMLRQVIPVISESSAIGSNEASPHTVHMGSGNALDSSTQENTDAGTSSHRRNDHPITPNSKRQRRE